MSELETEATRPTDAVGRVLFFISYIFALIGGFLISGLSIMTVISVFGRYLFSAPIPGDFEMIALGTAVTVFLFLPYCHLMKGNVIVDLFLSWAPKSVQAFFDVLSNLLLAVIAGAISWRMWFGTQDMIEYNEITFILGIPIWWVFPFAVVSFALLSVSALYTSVCSFGEMRQ
ncbi:MAG: TRAP transporter small permease [Rhodospirillales bacterium]|nr:TRAP transporter small permease [Rhodospirillales bacterium]